MKRVIIHPGLPKTGTTALQDWFYTQRSKLLHLGIEYPQIGLTFDSVAPAHHNIAREFTSRLWDEPHFDTSLGLASDLAKYAENCESDLLISSEGIWTLVAFPKLRQHAAEFISALAQAASIEIWITLRNAAAYEESLFFFRGITGGDTRHTRFRNREFILQCAEGFLDGIAFLAKLNVSVINVGIYSRSVNRSFASRLISSYASHAGTEEPGITSAAHTDYDWSKEVNVSAPPEFKYAILMRSVDEEFKAVPSDKWLSFSRAVLDKSIKLPSLPGGSRCSFSSRMAYEAANNASAQALERLGEIPNVRIVDDSTLMTETPSSFFFEDTTGQDQASYRQAMLQAITAA